MRMALHKSRLRMVPVSASCSPFASLVARRDAALIAALVVAVHLANALLAGWIGYLSFDSWDYLRMAKSENHDVTPQIALPSVVASCCQFRTRN